MNSISLSASLLCPSLLLILLPALFSFLNTFLTISSSSSVFPVLSSSSSSLPSCYPSAVIALNSTVFLLWKIRPLNSIMEKYFICSPVNRESSSFSPSHSLSLLPHPSLEFLLYSFSLPLLPTQREGEGVGCTSPSLPPSLLLFLPSLPPFLPPFLPFLPPFLPSLPPSPSLLPFPTLINFIAPAYHTPPPLTHHNTSCLTVFIS